MVSIFRSYHPAVIFMLLLYAVLLRMVLFIQPITFEIPQNTNLLSQFTYKALAAFIGDRNFIFHIMGTALVFFQALYFNYLVNYYRIMSKSSYLPAFSFILVSSLFVEFTLLTSSLIANTFLLFALAKIFAWYKKDKVTGAVFDTAFLISIASLFFFPYIVFFLFVLTSLTVLRPFSLREYLIAAIGLLLPYYFIGVYFFWIGLLPEFLHSLVISELRFNAQVMERSTRILTVGIPVLAVIAWTALYIQANLFRMVVQVRNYLIVVVWFFIAGILSLLIQFTGELGHFVWLSIPAGLAFAFFFAEFRRKAIVEIVHLFLILAILFFQFYYLLNPSN
ncbi:MAG: hypothetical protein ABIO46_11240 [Chitinophagales bacterium]